MQNQLNASNLYNSVINDVISNVRESFLDENVEEHTLQELKTIWLQKLTASRAIESNKPEPVNHQQLLDNKMKNSGASSSHSGSLTNSSTSSKTSAAKDTPAGGLQEQIGQNPSRMVPVQISIPAQVGNPNSRPQALTVQVPAHALQHGGASGSTLQTVLTSAITQALSMQSEQATVFLQQQINQAFSLS